MARRITKREILQGKKQRKSIPIEELDGELVIRPITDGEAAEVQQTMLKGLSADAVRVISANRSRFGSGEVNEQLLSELNLSGDDIGRLQFNEGEANRRAVAYALSVDNERWQSEDVDQLLLSVTDRKGLLRKLASEVYELSGMAGGSAAEAKKFRGNAGSDDDAESSRSGLPADADAE